MPSPQQCLYQQAKYFAQTKFFCHFFWWFGELLFLLGSPAGTRRSLHYYFETNDHSKLNHMCSTANCYQENQEDSGGLWHTTTLSCLA